MSRLEPQINLRVPAELKDKLDKAAKANRRSLTAEVVARLKQTFDQEEVGGVNIAATGQVDKELMDRLRRMNTPGTQEYVLGRRLAELYDLARLQAEQQFLNEATTKIGNSKLRSKGSA